MAGSVGGRAIGPWQQRFDFSSHVLRCAVKDTCDVQMYGQGDADTQKTLGVPRTVSTSSVCSGGWAVVAHSLPFQSLLSSHNSCIDQSPCGSMGVAE